MGLKKGLSSIGVDTVTVKSGRYKNRLSQFENLKKPDMTWMEKFVQEKAYALQLELLANRGSVLQRKGIDNAVINE